MTWSLSPTLKHILEALSIRDTPRHQYFAYNAHMKIHQMIDHCPSARVLGPAKLAGYRLDFTKEKGGWECGVADVVKEEGAEVWGVIYDISDEDFKKLDVSHGHPYSAERFQTMVEGKEKNYTDVWVYTIVNKLGFVPPTGFYLDWLKEAADEFQFPTSYKSFLDTVPVKRSTEK